MHEYRVTIQDDQGEYVLSVDGENAVEASINAGNEVRNNPSFSKYHPRVIAIRTEPSENILATERELFGV